MIGFCPLVECLWRKIEPYLTRKEVIASDPWGLVTNARGSRLASTNVASLESTSISALACTSCIAYTFWSYTSNVLTTSVPTFMVHGFLTRKRAPFLLKRASSDLEVGSTSFLAVGDRLSVCPQDWFQNNLVIGACAQCHQELHGTALIFNHDTLHAW